MASPPAPRRAPALLDRLVVAVARIAVTIRHPALMLRFRRKLGWWPDPVLPRTYQEKFLWRKIFDRNPEFVTCCDKLAAKALIRRRCPELPVPETLWFGADPALIPYDMLQQPVMLKARAGFATNMQLSRELLRNGRLGKIVARWRRSTRHRSVEEWGYRDVTEGLLLEPFLTLGGDGLPTDLKVYVAGGKVASVWAVDKLQGKSLTLTPDGAALAERDTLFPDVDQALLHSPELAALARDAVRLAPILAGDLDFARIDFLVEAGRLLAGEITIYSSAGYETLANLAAELELERLWDLRLAHPMRFLPDGPAGLYMRAFKRILDRENPVPAKP